MGWVVSGGCWSQSGMQCILVCVQGLAGKMKWSRRMRQSICMCKELRTEEHKLVKILLHHPTLQPDPAAVSSRAPDAKKQTTQNSAQQT